MLRIRRETNGGSLGRPRSSQRLPRLDSAKRIAVRWRWRFERPWVTLAQELLRPDARNTRGLRQSREDMNVREVVAG